MIIYNNENILKSQIEEDIKELEKYKNSYNARIKLYNVYLSTIDAFKDGNIVKEGLKVQELFNKIKTFEIQSEIINNNIDLLKSFLNNEDSQNEITMEKDVVDKYNQKYSEIRNNYINNALLEEDMSLNFINGMLSDFTGLLNNMEEEHKKKIEKIENEKNNVNIIEQEIEINKEIKQEEYVKTNEEQVTEIDNNTNENINRYNEIKNNDILLISEKEGKVILPYTSQEVTEILYNNQNKYETEEDVIKDKFTRKFSDYKVQFISRYKEAMKLAKEREGYGFVDSISLAMEMMGKKMLHPAIISACRTINELDVYLDCLDKNELDDFKIFKIKYELYPMAVKQKRKFEFS